MTFAPTRVKTLTVIKTQLEGKSVVVELGEFQLWHLNGRNSNSSRFFQLLETGFFHADPHPGNLLVTPEGKLALIDFGLCAEVPLPDTKTMTLAIVHMMQVSESQQLSSSI